ncbi:MAG: hypothetical protein DWQ37_18105 [Planctomycetota bacterium]|nr:MAG: hypothetical protein DWQ37_18105 [Planctomycetota bacterium]
MRYVWIFLLLAVVGCGGSPPADKEPINTAPRVQLGKPTRRDLKRTVGQPSFIDAYEQTAIYAKLPAYVLDWKVDIGDRIKANQLLATLWIPELKEELALKKAQVDMDRALVDQAKKLVEVAEGRLAAATATVSESKANVGQSEALVIRWESEVNRLSKMVEQDAVDVQILDESQRQLQASVAMRDAALATVQTSEAEKLAQAAELDKARVDVEVAKAQLEVSTADYNRVKALYGYTRLVAPYDGIVVLRNANTGDFVLPATGDPSASNRSPDQSAAKATPIYVVARTDVVRVYVDVPEQEADYIVSEVDVNAGDPRPVTKAAVQVSAFQTDELPGQVTRSSWALNFTSRTLRAEIDLHNPDAKLLPGMYAYGRVMFERKNAMVLPNATVSEIGNDMVCYVYKDGKAIKTLLQTGVRNDDWTEVLQKQVGGEWKEFEGNEQVILGNMAVLFDEEPVVVEK